MEVILRRWVCVRDFVALHRAGTDVFHMGLYKLGNFHRVVQALLVLVGMNVCRNVCMLVRLHAFIQGPNAPLAL